MTAAEALSNNRDNALESLSRSSALAHKGVVSWMGTDYTLLIKAAATICSGGVSGGLAELPQFKDGHNLRASITGCICIVCLTGSCSSWQPTLNWLGWHWKLHYLPSGTGFFHLRYSWCSQKCRNCFVLVILSVYYELCWVRHSHVYDYYTELGAVAVWGQHLIDEIWYALCIILSPANFWQSCGFVESCASTVQCLNAVLFFHCCWP